MGKNRSVMQIKVLALKDFLFIVELIPLVVASCGECTRFDAWCAPYWWKFCLHPFGIYPEIANNHKRVVDWMEQSSGLDDTRTSHRYRLRSMSIKKDLRQRNLAQVDVHLQEEKREKRLIKHTSQIEMRCSQYGKATRRA